MSSVIRQGGGGVSDHGALTGLGDDDHALYATDTNLSDHEADTTSIHGITDTSTLQLQPSEGAFANGDKTKLDGIATNATANPNALDNVVEDTTPQLGGELDAQSNNITDLGDVTFKTGVNGGTLRTGTSAADKFVLQAYKTGAGAGYQTVVELDAGTTPVLEIDGDFLQIVDDIDGTKQVKFDLSSDTTATETTLTFAQTADRVITFPDATGTLQVQPSEGAFVDGDKTKLDGIATGATANSSDATLLARANHTGTQTASTISDFDTEVSNNADVTANTAKISYTDAAKVATIETNADVTDTANVTSAGALMDSEVDADIKTLSLPANTTISTFGASLVDDAAASNARTTLGLGTIATVAAPSGTVVGTTDTQTLTNKTISGASNTLTNIPWTALPSGTVVQQVSTNYSSVATGTTTIPFDDTIPQITEGTQFITQAITPLSSSNILYIDVIAHLSTSTAREIIMALFQDTTSSALHAVSTYQATGTGRSILTIQHRMTAGTTSSTTFKIRAGTDSSATTTFNGYSGGRIFGAIPKSSVRILEVKA